MCRRLNSSGNDSAKEEDSDGKSMHNRGRRRSRTGRQSKARVKKETYVEETADNKENETEPETTINDLNDEGKLSPSPSPSGVNRRTAVLFSSKKNPNKTSANVDSDSVSITSSSSKKKSGRAGRVGSYKGMSNLFFV